MGERHLILGGGGFIGRHVALELASQGVDVIVAGRRPASEYFPENLSSLVEWKFLELGAANWDELVADIDVVHYYAWGSLPATANANPGGDLLANVIPLIGVLDALKRRGRGRVIFSSSGGTVYGRVHDLPIAEDHPIAPISAYGVGKAAAELYLGLYRSMYGIDCRIARIANPFGAGQNLSHGQGAASTFAYRALTKQPITLWGTGEVIRDYLHVTDVARFLVVLATAQNVDEFIFNVGSGVGFSLKQIVFELEKRLSRPLDIVVGEGRPIDVPANILSIERAKRILGWEPTLSFSEGIARTLEDMRKNLDTTL